MLFQCDDDSTDKRARLAARSQQVSPPLSPPVASPVLDSQISIGELLLTQRTPVERMEEEMSALRAEVRHLRTEVSRLAALVDLPCATATLSTPASPASPASPPAAPTDDLSQEVAIQLSYTPSSLTIDEQLKRHTQVVRDGIVARSIDFAHI